MTLKELEDRLLHLEQRVEKMESDISGSKKRNPKAHWWREHAGRFKDDPVFDEIVRLGKEYRESLHPDKKRKKQQPRKKKE